MQELLPFGEYVSPERSQPVQQYYMGLETWELERILARLAVTNGAATLGPGRRRDHPRTDPVIGTSHYSHGWHLLKQLVASRHIVLSAFYTTYV